MLNIEDIPEDYPVKPVADGFQTPENIRVLDPVNGGLMMTTDYTTCGTCGLTWDDKIVTGMTPAPGSRCPFEYFHEQTCENAECGNVLDDGDTDGVCSSCALNDDTEYNCEQCQDRRFLVNQSYGEADLPDGAIPVQLCDECARPEDLDENACRAAYEMYGQAWGFAFGMHDPTNMGNYVPCYSNQNGAPGDYWIIPDPDRSPTWLMRERYEAIL